MAKVRLSAVERRQLEEVDVRGRQYFKVKSSYEGGRLLSAREVRDIRATTRKANRLYEKAYEYEAERNPDNPALGSMAQAVVVRKEAKAAFSFYAGKSLRQSERIRKKIREARAPRHMHDLGKIEVYQGGTLVANYAKAIRIAAANGGVSEELTRKVVRWFLHHFVDGYMLEAAIETGAMPLTGHQAVKLPALSTLAYDWYYDFNMVYSALMSLGMPDYAKEMDEDLDEDAARQQAADEE